MDMTEWLLQLAGDELEHIEDSLRSGEFSEMKEIYVHATDGRGMYAGMKNILAASTDEAIAIAQATWRDVPASCRQWFATTDKRYVKSAKTHK